MAQNVKDLERSYPLAEAVPPAAALVDRALRARRA